MVKLTRTVKMQQLLNAVDEDRLVVGNAVKMNEKDDSHVVGRYVDSMPIYTFEMSELTL